jgi:hypothetical protein
VDLTAAGERIVADLVRLYGDSPDVRAIATQAARFADLADEAGQRVMTEGLTLVTPQGPVRHPCVQVEKDARLGFLSCLRVIRSRPKLAGSHRPSKVDAWWRDRPDLAAKQAKKVAKYFS